MPIPVPLSAGKKPWQLKVRELGIVCACWDCLRKAGITPHKDSHETHKRHILPGSPIFSTASGNVLTRSDTDNAEE